MDIAREEVPDGGMNSEGGPKTGFHSLAPAATTTLSFPHSSRKKRARHTFPPHEAWPSMRRRFHTARCPKNPMCLVALRFTHSKQRGGAA